MSDVAVAAPRSSVASLKPALLARKGGAKPAMRPQVALDNDSGADLGWNDFGLDDHSQRVVPIQHGRARKHSSKARTKAIVNGGKAAFTLRLDPERHLKLRLACALDARSAQALVTDALDRLLASMPELESLAHNAATVRRGKRRPAKA